MNFLHNFQFAEWILNTAIQSTIIIFVGCLLVKFFKRRSAPLRSAVVILSLFLLAVLPLLNLSPLSLAPKTFGPIISVNLKASPAAESVIKSSSTPETFDVSDFEGNAVAGITSQHNAPIRKILPGFLWIALINIFGFLWIAVASVFFIRFLKGTLSLRKLRKGLTEVDYPHLDQILTEAQSVFPRTIHARIYESTQITSPMALGFFKPFILIPGSSIKKMSRSMIRGVFIHELSHIYHRDHLIGVLQRVVTVLNWWNPLTYTLSTALSRAREEISDNYVLLRNEPKEYATCLIEFVEKSSFFKRHPVATAMASAHIPIKERVKLILSKERNMETRLKKSTFVLAVCVAFLFFILISGYRLTFASVESEIVNPVVSETDSVFPEQSQPQEKQNQKTEPIRAEGKVTAPKLLIKVEPAYPEEARKAGIEGVVILEVTTDKKGLVQEVKPLRSIPALDDAAIEAIKQWVYEPMLIDGKPHGIVFTVTCKFKLDDKETSGIAGGVEGGVQGGAAGGVTSGVEGGVKGGVQSGVEGGVKGGIEVPLKVTGDSEAPKLISKVEPIYPDSAKKAGLKGTVILEATVDEDGKVIDTKVLRSIPELDKAAIEAVEQWIYEPFILDGKPKKVQITVTITFHLK